MPPDLKLVISFNNNVIQTVSKDLSDQGLVKSIEDFIVITNATMTKLIEASGDGGDCLVEEEPDDSDDDEEDICMSPKKRKK